jgi:hypothetical protein
VLIDLYNPNGIVSGGVVGVQATRSKQNIREKGPDHISSFVHEVLFVVCEDCAVIVVSYRTMHVCVCPLAVNAASVSFETISLFKQKVRVCCKNS